jgi:hypothetical protein
MMLTLFVAGVAHARLFTAPAPNVASPQTYMPVESAASPLLQPQVFVDVPPVVLPQPDASRGPALSLGAALLAAGVGVVAGRQAMLFMSGGSSKRTPGKASPKPTKFKGSNVAAEGRASNRGGPYQANKKNIQTQRSGFGNFVQKFQLAGGKSKYGVPIFLPNGNVNPAYLAAERKDLQQQSKLNTKTAEVKRKGLIKKGAFELADYVRKAIGPVGSGSEYYQSGR